jgi:hydroxymethylpyrimidine kinase / phosphomethylpyrimidine kinase / thiamine-phosphate diphosphorylase
VAHTVSHCVWCADGRSIASLEDMRQAAQDLLSLGPQHVLLKGGHLSRESATYGMQNVASNGAAAPQAAGAQHPMVDVLASAGEPASVYDLSAPFIDTRNTHGTGCTLASSLAAHMARGMSVAAAARCAQRYVQTCLRESAALSIGAGAHGPMDHGAGLSRQRPATPAAVDYSLYAVTDAHLNDKHARALGDTVRAAVAGGATMIQIRCGSATVLQLAACSAMHAQTVQ